MKTVYVVELQSDGIISECFTNIKALHSFLVDELEVAYSTLILLDKEYNRKEYGGCTYSNLLKVIRENQKLNRVCVAQLTDLNAGEVTISELRINSK
ncbi:MAG TPA: hypothetical protein VD794_02155 [Flavisolibacter sp.]|nr:hypothetical protein [Flavisolibacter sp.]